MKKVSIAIIGGGPAGLAAALSAREAGGQEVLILERDKELGGILNQCIHNGFGLHTFKEELTGPEYAARYIEMVQKQAIPYLLNTLVIDIRREGTEKIITAMNRQDGMFEVRAQAVILAMGCRERGRGALNIPGYRPAGIYSAGTAQRYVNMEGRMPGREAVILGSGDIGLIMARRMTLEGAKVKAVAELMPYSGGLKRNIVQCLEDYDIPLLLSHTVVDIHGKDRVTGVTLAQVDASLKPIQGTEQEVACDTLLLSCGLIPENELTQELGADMSPVTSGPVVNESLETDIEGVFACGNVLHVHDLVDYVSAEAKTAGARAAAYVRGEGTGEGLASEPHIPIRAEKGVRYTVPFQIRVPSMEATQLIRFRVGNVFKDVFLTVYFDDIPVIKQKKRNLAPGEMEQLTLKKTFIEAFLQENKELKEIRVCIEKGGEADADGK